jgi:AraC family transcriptional regulator
MKHVLLDPSTPLDTTLRSLSSEFVRLREGLLAAHATLPEHAHGDYLVRLILDGSLRETIGGRSSDVGHSMITVSHPDDAHGVRVDASPLRYFSVELARPWTDSLQTRSLATPRSGRIDDVEVRRLALRLYGELVAPDDLAPLASEGLATELLVRLARTARPARAHRSPRWIDGVVAVLRDEYQTPPTLAQLAANAAVHPGHLSRTFRAFYGCSIGEFVRGVRVEVARRLLAETRWTLAEVAAAAGFSDQSHFCRVFKRIVGTTPARYREALRR